MNFGTACTGAGGIDLGLRQAGLRCKFQCEILPYDRTLLAQNFPECTSRFADVQEIGSHCLPPVDLFAFGFMCTDIASVNRNSRGIHAETRSGLTWRECSRVASELHPRFVLIENVASLYTNGLDTVLSTLASFGYDAEWHCIPASHAGAPHKRERVFIMAYANHVTGLQTHTPTCTFGDYWNARKDADRSYWEQTPSPDWAVPEAVSDRMANGVPYRMDRVKAIGNAVCPSITKVIGQWYRVAFAENGGIL